MPVRLPTRPRPTFHRNVSVVVLNYNRGAMTGRCLEALRADPTPLLREVVVVDNGSAPHELALLREGLDEQCRLVEIGVNRFFGEGNNIGAEHATGDYLVFLNNDALVTPGWLDQMASAMEDDEDVAAVGAMLVYPDGLVQEVGAMVLPTGDAVQIGKGAVWDPDHYTQICPVDYCSAACLLVRRDNFLAVGGFSYQYEPAYYEDSDLCLKLWSSVGKVVVNPRARVVHYENHTTSDRSLKLDGVVLLNRERFLGTWGEWLSRRALSHSVLDGVGGPASVGVRDPATVRPRRVQRPLAAVFTPYEVVPGGGERYVFELMAHLSSIVGEGRVALCTPAHYSTTRIAQISEVFGFDTPVAVPVRMSDLDRSTVEIAVTVGNHVVPPTGGFGRRNVFHCQFPFVAKEDYIEEHRADLADYDEVWVNSRFTARYVRGMAAYYDLECPPVRVVNPPSTWPGAGPGLPWVERRRVLSVGRFFTEGHDKRQDVVIDVVRHLADRGIRLELVLAGALHTHAESRRRYGELVEYARGIECRFYPNASRARIAELYSSSAVLVHAAGFGLDPFQHPERLEHFGIVPVEAASFGCIPVVYGEGGPAEVVAELGVGATFHTVGECADAVSRLLADPGATEELSHAVRAGAERFSPAAFHAHVSAALEAIGVQAAGK